MAKKITLVVVFFVLASCNNKENYWLNNYKEIRCKYIKIQELRNKDSLNKINKLGEELFKIEIEINEIEKPISTQIAQLEALKNEIVIKYLQQSIQISKIQEDKYGHNSTAEFEHKLSENEREGNSKTKVYDDKILFLNQKLIANIKYQELKEKENKFKSEIVEAYIPIKEKYSKQIESLHYELNYLNSQFKEITSDLDEKEKQIFTRKKDNIKANPCKIN